ncbi:HTH APSES-type domain-containing protein [Mycena indigotica]|uniref:HTH APSES-type domain-containing protein n=1 Tax=Mycena indigotica TaxID=2126181 RepID=A0A8H6T8D5_9AGAR|nr:HTH APSES-type domain-containing protein [Mycena indigotica]KAF7311832.1 HTH APSES-type domain-containing protein [Mycena indigotica]
MASTATTTTIFQETGTTPVPMPASPTSEQANGRFRPFASSTHQVTKGRYITSNDPRGYIPVYEYPLNNQWIMMDIDDGYVLWTGIWKALGNSKADIVKMVDSQPELARVIRRVRGGYLKIQGTWMPFEVALRLARRVAWNIREDLVPLFGPTFPSTCLSPDQPGYGQVVASSGARRRARRQQAQSTAGSSSTRADSSSEHHGHGQPLALSMPQLPPVQLHHPLQQLPLPPHPQPNPHGYGQGSRLHQNHTLHSRAVSQSHSQHSWPSPRPSAASDWYQDREKERERLPGPNSPSPFVSPGARYSPYPLSTSSRKLSSPSLWPSGSHSSSARSPPLTPAPPSPASNASIASIHIPLQRLPPRTNPSGAGYTLPPISAFENIRGGLPPPIDDPRTVLKRLRGEVDDVADDHRTAKRSRSPEEGHHGVKRVYSVPSLQIPPSSLSSSGNIAVSPVHRRSLGQLPLPPHPAPAGLAGREREHQFLRLAVPLNPRSSLSDSSASVSSRAPSPITPRSPDSDGEHQQRRPSLVPLEVLKAHHQTKSNAGTWPGPDSDKSGARLSALRYSCDDEEVDGPATTKSAW